MVVLGLYKYGASYLNSYRKVLKNGHPCAQTGVKSSLRT